MSKILRNTSKIITILDSLKDKNFEECVFICETKELAKINGIGISTFSKLMYFFNVKINGNPCIIFDSRVKNALVRYSQTEFLDKYNQQNINSYPIFVEGISRISKDTGLEAESIEFILFSVSGSYKKFREFNTKYKKRMKKNKMHGFYMFTHCWIYFLLFVVIALSFYGLLVGSFPNIKVVNYHTMIDSFMNCNFSLDPIS